jgi:hypothetical protein
MKRICIFVVCSLLVTSCSKSALQPNVRYHNQFIGIEGHDNLARNASMFCVAGDTLKLSDTIDIITYTAPDPNKFVYKVGTFYIVENPDTSRNYWGLKVFIKSWIEYL